MLTTKKIKRRLLGLAFAATIVWTALATVGCDGNVYVGVGIAGPYVGYPYGYPYAGGVVVGRPF